MHIAFNFNYTHTNGLFERLLIRIKTLSTTPLLIYQDGERFIIEASGNQNELEALAKLVSALVPHSLFLEDYSMKEIDKVSDFDNLHVEELFYEIPYCPECQTRVIETFNPFEECSVCGFSEKSLIMDDLYSFSRVDADTEENFFIKLVDGFLETSKLTLPTFNGLRNFTLLDSSEKSNKAILICNPKHISENFVLTSGELELLMMVEKPLIRLKPKLKFRSKYGLDEPFYPIFFADDKVTLALCETLKSRGIEAIFCDNFSTLRVASALNEKVIVKAGRDLLPWHSNISLNNSVFCKYGDFEALGGLDGLEVNSKVNMSRSKSIEYVTNNDHQNGKIHFEPSHASLRSIIIEQELQGRSLCGIYLSRENYSQICSYSPKIGYTSIVEFSDDEFSQPKQILEAIARIDESGSRLIKNFQKHFPELYEQIEKVHFKEDSNISMITRLWAMASLVIGIYKGDNIVKACETLESTAIEFNGKSGPRIDYKIMSSEDGYILDLRLAIRSAISFKLAGVDEYLLSFGFIDSFADFIALQVENADANIGISGVTLSGNLFENRQLLMRTYNALSANYPIYKNNRLGLDGANVALGAITLGSE